MDNMILKQFVAVRAVIEKAGKFLLIRESTKYEGGANQGKYDFPGGKIKIGESPVAALERETLEEVGLSIKIIKPFYVTEWKPVVRGEKIQIIGIFFLCQSFSDNVKLSADHDNYVWATSEEATNLSLIQETANAINYFNPGQLEAGV